MNIFVTGANGQLGREMQRLGAVSPNNYIFSDAAELDVTDAGAVRRAAEQTRAEAIVNCAADTDVERAEEIEAAADLLNRLAPAILAAAAAATGLSSSSPEHRPHKDCLQGSNKGKGFSSVPAR